MCWPWSKVRFQISNGLLILPLDLNGDAVRDGSKNLTKCFPALCPPLQRFFAICISEIITSTWTSAVFVALTHHQESAQYILFLIVAQSHWFLETLWYSPVTFSRESVYTRNYFLTVNLVQWSSSIFYSVYRGKITSFLYMFEVF